MKSPHLLLTISMHCKQLFPIATLCVASLPLGAQVSITQPQTPLVPNGSIVITVPSTNLQSTATITLGQPIISFAPFPFGLRAPYTLPVGTRLELVPKAPGTEDVPVTWYKDGKVVATGTGPLVIANATPTDSGNYYALGAGGGTDSAAVLISSGGQRLLNVSTRARIDSNQSSFLSGFVIQPGPAATLVLIRAVGPALGNFGVNDALAAPQLKLFDGAGHERQAVSTEPIEGLTIYPSPVDAAKAVGAFPLSTNSKDVARVYFLPAGAYTAQVSSADGGAGTVLLEVYDVPLPIGPAIALTQPPGAK